MRKVEFYPGTHDATKTANRQSDVPSQESPVGVPYSPDYQLDVQLTQPGYETPSDQAAAAGGPNGLGASGPGSGVCAQNYTRYTFDSRPAMGQDFASPSNPNFVLTTDQTGAFTVPPGMIAVIRGIKISPYMIPNSIDANGMCTKVILLSVLLNNAAQLGFTNIDVSDCYPGGAFLPCFFMVPSGVTISASLTQNSLQMLTTAAAIHAGVSFYGNLLLDDGRNIVDQAGNQDPEPVCIDSGSVAALKPKAAATAAAPTAPVYPDSILNLPNYNGPLPPSISVITYLQNLDIYHAWVNDQIAQWKAAHPGVEPTIKYS